MDDDDGQRTTTEHEYTISYKPEGSGELKMVNRRRRMDTL